MREQLPRAEDELNATFKVASEDVFALLKRRQNESNNATDRRALVRSIFAFVESMLFAMKQEILKAPQGFTLGEFTLLRDESYELADNGEVRAKTAKLTLKSNLKFTFASWAKATGTTCKLDLSENGWQKFQAAVRVRDRLMHPKRATDLEVSDNEIEGATAAFFWFHTTFAVSMSQVVIATIQHLKATGEWDDMRPANEEDGTISPA